MQQQAQADQATASQQAAQGKLADLQKQLDDLQKQVSDDNAAHDKAQADLQALQKQIADAQAAAAARAAFVARQPMGRLGQADEIAATAVLLASDEATFMTGSNIVIDGGMSL